MTAPWIDVSDTTPRIAYTATAGQIAFTVPFVFFESDDLRVYQNDVLLTLEVQYSVAGAEQTGGTVTLTTGTVLGDEITISRHVAIEQTSHVPVFGPLDVPSINIQFSKLIAILQQLEDELLRSLRLPDSTAVTGDMLLVTAPVAGQWLKWNATENGVESAAVILPAGSYSIATPTEVSAGASNTVLMTPYGVAQVKSDTAPATLAWDHGVPGDSSDQTTALQAIIDGLPAEGGAIISRGNVNFTQLDNHGRRNISFIGAHGAGTGAGASNRTIWRCTAGAIGTSTAAINCLHTNNVSFRGLTLTAADGAFNGRLIDYGGTSPVPGQDSAYMTIDDCIINVAGGIGLSLYGATNGRFSQINFNGAGRHILLQDTAGTGFCNDHQFSTCVFHPVSGYPVLGSGEGITFLACCWQAGSSTGIGRAVVTSNQQQFLGMNFIGCTFYDQTVAGGEWIVARWGAGFNVTGANRFGGIAGAYAIDIGGVVGGDPQEGGVRGFNISGNFFDNFTAAITFSGTNAAKSNARGGVIGGNGITNGFLLASYNEVEQLVLLPNSIYGAPNEIGSHMAFLGLPSYADDATAAAVPLVSGQLYRVGNAVHIVG